VREPPLVGLEGFPLNETGMMIADEYRPFGHSAQYFRKLDRYVVFKLQRWLRRKQQRTRRAYRRPPDEWCWQQALFRCSGRNVRVW
jgi:hypothetical protein